VTDPHTRLLGTVHDTPGPDGFRSRPVGRLHLGDALDELAATEGSMSDETVRRAYEARIKDRMSRRGGEA
jgi:hypothetical protein